MGSYQLNHDDVQSAISQQLAWAKKFKSILHPLLGRSLQFQAWEHYPRRDAMDISGHWQFYYHAHDASRDGGVRHPHEHGHIHLFHRNPRGVLSHVAGLSLDAKGSPLTWFATNQWVTGERWKPARSLCQELPGLQLEVRGPLAGAARWLSSMVSAYAKPLSDMLHARDASLSRHCVVQGVTPAQAWNDRRISVWSSYSINWPQDAVALKTEVSSYCN